MSAEGLYPIWSSGAFEVDALPGQSADQEKGEVMVVAMCDGGAYDVDLVLVEDGQPVDAIGLSVDQMDTLIHALVSAKAEIARASGK